MPMLQPIDLDLTRRLSDPDFAREYMTALEEQQRDSDKRYEARIAELKAALHRAVEWGVMSKGHDGSMARQLREWIDAGMSGPLPPEPEWLRDMRETLTR